MVAAGCSVLNVNRIALACKFNSIFAKQPTLIFSPAGVNAPVLNDEAPYKTSSEMSGMPEVIFPKLKI